MMDDVSISRSDVTDPANRSPGRGRRPAAEVRKIVLDTAASILFEDGLSAVTFERVAAVARASKTTLYKWWPSPGALAAEAFFERVRVELDFPQSADPIDDIRHQLRKFVHLMTQERAGQVLRELIGAGQSDANLRTSLAENYARPRRAEAARAIERARRSGHISTDADAAVLVSQLWGACYQFILVLDEPVSDELIDELLANALHL